jgi:hypothetical protein
MARRSAAARTIEAPIQEPSLPGVIIPPSEAAENERSAYWLELIAEPAKFRAAIASEDFFPLLRRFPASFWSDGRLSLYLYRRPDEEGLMLKNPEGQRKYTKVLRQPVDEEFISQRWGGGKYTLYLKLDNDETLKESTFLIDGPPKAQPGQVIEKDGKTVSIGTAAPAADAPRSDVASVIQASADANKQNMEILAQGSKAAIELVREQASAASKPEAKSELMQALIPLLPALLERFLAPPPQQDVLALLTQAKTLFAAPAAEDLPEPKDPPLTQAMDMLEKVTGKSFSQLMRDKSAPAAEATPSWLPIALGVADKFFAAAPSLLQQATYAATLRFQREVWLRTARPGEAAPAALIAANPPQLPQQQPPTQHQPQAQQPQPAGPGEVTAEQLVPHIIQMVCHGFDTKCTGDETAVAIAFQFGEHIEALGIDALLRDPAQIAALVEGHPLLKQRSAHARWPSFQEAFMGYMGDRFAVIDDGEMGDDEEPKGPQPVA